MIAASLLALAVFLLLVAVVLAIASVRRAALAVVAVAVVVFLAGAGLGVAGQRQYDTCEQDYKDSLPAIQPLGVNQPTDRCHPEHFGLHDPF